MLTGLRDNLRLAIKRVIKSSGVDKELIASLALDVQRALINADIPVDLVQQISENLKRRAVEDKPPPGLSYKDHIVRVLYEELTALMGGTHEFSFTPGRTNVAIMLGIQGSGKTTTTSKLARLLTGQGYRVGVIGADTYRPAALEQLRTMCGRAGVEVYGERSKEAPAIVRNGLAHFSRSDMDVVLVDTAGRHKEERSMLDEMRQIASVARPDLTLLVVDGTIGRQCRAQAQAFHDAVAVGGIIVTKLDSSAKGGGALAAASATRARVMYIGTGERIDDIEPFSSTRFVGRLLGMGDVQAVLDMARRLESEADDVRLKRIASGRLTIDDFFFQLSEVKKMGSIGGLLESVPGLSGLAKTGGAGKVEEKLEEKMERWRYIIQSMTVQEKIEPSLNASRVQRISRGSGWSQQDVKDMLKAYKNSKTMIKSSRSREMRNAIKRMGFG